MSADMYGFQFLSKFVRDNAESFKAIAEAVGAAVTLVLAWRHYIRRIPPVRWFVERTKAVIKAIWRVSREEPFDARMHKRVEKYVVPVIRPMIDDAITQTSAKIEELRVRNDEQHARDIAHTTEQFGLVNERIDGLTEAVEKLTEKGP